MALIDGYDLSTGVKMSDAVPTPNNCRVTSLVSGAQPKKVAKIRLWVDSTLTGKALLLDENDKPMEWELWGNGLKSSNPIVINASNLYVEVIPLEDKVGLISVDVINS